MLKVNDKTKKLWEKIGIKYEDGFSLFNKWNYGVNNKVKMISYYIEKNKIKNPTYVRRIITKRYVEWKAPVIPIVWSRGIVLLTQDNFGNWFLKYKDKIIEEAKQLATDEWFKRKYHKEREEKKIKERDMFKIIDDKRFESNLRDMLYFRMVFRLIGRNKGKYGKGKIIYTEG